MPTFHNINIDPFLRPVAEGCFIIIELAKGSNDIITRYMRFSIVINHHTNDSDSNESDSPYRFSLVINHHTNDSDSNESGSPIGFQW